jgi:F-type H+-transporting ATPase subunit a
MSLPGLTVVPAATISVGEHETFQFLGLTFNLDTMYATVLALAMTIALLTFAARKATAGVPGRVQLITETVISQVRTYAEQALGHKVPTWLVPFGMTVFFFILFSNWLGWFPSGHHPERLAPPTSDVNLVYAMSLTVVILYTYVGIKHKRHRYFTDWFRAKPFILGAFIKIIEEIVKPLSLSLRLFGNILSGGVMLAVIALLPIYLFPLYGFADWGWRIFDSGLIAPIQAFIFSFLTILYFGQAVEEPH